MAIAEHLEARWGKRVAVNGALIVSNDEQMRHFAGTYLVRIATFGLSNVFRRDVIPVVRVVAGLVARTSRAGVLEIIDRVEEVDVTIRVGWRWAACIHVADRPVW